MTDQEILIVTTGRVEPKKGQELAIRALAQVKRDHGSFGGIKLAFAGTARDDYAPKICRLSDSLGVGDRVLMLGYRDDVKDLLAASDIFCLPSYAEGMPISIIEAMAMAVPVVATAVDGIPEQVDDRSGILVCSPLSNEKQCVRELAAAFARLAHSEERRRKLAAAARDRARTEFHPSINVEHYYHLIRRLTEAHGAIRNVEYGEGTAPMPVGSSVDFGSPKEAWKILEAGWGATRRRGVWSEGDASSLTIALRGNTKRPVVSLRLEPYLRGRNKAQQVEVVVNDVSCGVLVLLKKPLDRSSWLHLHLEPSKADRVVRIDLYYRNTVALPQSGLRGRSVLISRLQIGDMEAIKTRLTVRLLRRGHHLVGERPHNAARV